jgi:hypothetical protein
VARWRSFGPEWNPVLAVLAVLAAIAVLATFRSWLALVGGLAVAVALYVEVAS